VLNLDFGILEKLRRKNDNYLSAIEALLKAKNTTLKRYKNETPRITRRVFVSL